MVCPVCGARGVDRVLDNFNEPPVEAQDGGDIWHTYQFCCPECGARLKWVEHFICLNSEIQESDDE